MQDWTSYSNFIPHRKVGEISVYGRKFGAKGPGRVSIHIGLAGAQADLDLYAEVAVSPKKARRIAKEIIKAARAAEGEEVS